VVARVRFLEGLAQCATAAGTDLHKGAGEPVDVAAARVFRIGGADLLQQVAKLHFRNSERIAGLRP
jgi:ribonuclease HIII